MSPAPVIPTAALEAAARQHYVETDAREERVAWEALPENVREYHRLRVRGPLSAAWAAAGPTQGPTEAFRPTTHGPWPSSFRRHSLAHIPRPPRMIAAWTTKDEYGQLVTETCFVESCEVTIPRDLEDGKEEHWHYKMAPPHDATTLTIIVR